jgi:hypothetical protein
MPFITVEVVESIVRVYLDDDDSWLCQEFAKTWLKLSSTPRLSIQTLFDLIFDNALPALLNNLDIIFRLDQDKYQAIWILQQSRKANVRCMKRKT